MLVFLLAKGLKEDQTKGRWVLHKNSSDPSRAAAIVLFYKSRVESCSNIYFFVFADMFRIKLNAINVPKMELPP